MFHKDCQHCRAQLVAYVNGELGHRRARRVAGHLRTCDACYAAYVRERDTGRALTHDLALLGRPDVAQLNGLWANIEAQLAAPPTRTAQTPAWAHGLVGVALAMLVALPWTLLADDLVASAAVPVGATPAVMPEETPPGTHGAEAAPRKSATVALNLPTEDPKAATPTSTPAVAPIPDELP